MTENIYNNIDRVKRVTPLVTGIVIALLNFIQAPADSPPPLDLELGGAGTTAWNFTNIKPGDGGTSTVTLRNAGAGDGFVTLWISDLVAINGPAADLKAGETPGELGDFLLLDLTSQGLEANIPLPAAIKNFPQTAFSPHYVRITPLYAGETLSLDWKWELPYRTGNNIQGRGISFRLNYMLEELPMSVAPEIYTPPDPGNVTDAPINIAISGYRYYPKVKSRT